MFVLFAATLVGIVVAAVDCEPPLVLDSESSECVDLFGLANGTSSAEPDPELLALWNDEAMSAALWPATDENVDNGGNVKRQASSRKNWNPIENGEPKNSGPIRLANARDYRLTESIFPVLGLMEIWTNMLAPEIPPRRIDHEHQHGCYFLNYLKDWNYTQNIVPANVVLKSFMYEQDYLRIQKTPSITMKFLPSSVANDAQGGTPRLGFSCAKVDKLDQAMPVLSVVAPNVVANETKNWSRKDPFIAIYSPTGKISEPQHFIKVTSLLAALDVGPLLVQVALCGDFLKNTGRVSFANCGQDDKVSVYMIAVGYESNGENFADKFLIVQGSYGKGFGIQGQSKISLAFASTAYWGNLLFMTVRPQDSLRNRFLPRFDLPTFQSGLILKSGRVELNANEFPRALVFKRITVYDISVTGKSVALIFKDNPDRQQRVELLKSEKKSAFSATLNTVPPGRWQSAALDIVGGSGGVYLIEFSDVDEKKSLQFRDGAPGEALENAATTMTTMTAVVVLAWSITLFV